MKNIRLNSNLDHIKTIIEGIHKKDGYCCCKVGKLPDNLCPCNELIETQHCHCKLFIRER